VQDISASRRLKASQRTFQPSDPNPGALVFAQHYSLAFAHATLYTECGMSTNQYPEAIPVRVTTKMYREIKAIAEREYITLSQAVRKLIREALEKK